MLQSSVIVQIRDVIEISRSRYEVLEGLEMESRGEMTKGREVIQITPVAVDSDDAIPTAITAASTSSTQQSRKTGTHKLLLQDSAGLIIWGLELTSIEGIKEDEIIIGKKLCLKEGTMVARGVVLLEDEKVILMGGKVEEWQRKWKGGRMERLRRELGIEG